MASSPHIVLFPFMSKGHSIPIIHLARLLLHRHATVTMVATVANRPFFSDSLADTGASIVDLPFPENVNGSFGSQVEISPKQLREIATGLEESKVSFLWVVRKSGSELADGFENRVKERGIVVREWVDQTAILGHECVKGFLSHCGWNSVMESVCAKVPILAWPMMAEQHLNARMVVEEIKVGLRVETSNGSVRGFVKWQGLEKMVRELMQGEMGEEVRKKVGEFGEAARKAMEEGGSSWYTLNQFIDELQAQRGNSSKLCC